jgi:hypothetical protein
MQTQAIIPVLKFIGYNKGLFDLGSIAAQLGMFPDHVRMIVTDAEVFGSTGFKLQDFQIMKLLEMGERLGVIHKGTEFEVVPVQAEITIHEQQPPTEDFLNTYIKPRLAEAMGLEMLKRGLIDFKVIPWQQVTQKMPGFDRDWQLKAALKALKEK